MGSLIWLALVLFLIWLLAVVVFKVVGFAIHILVIIAVIAAAVWLFKRIF